jgi:regulator of ribonuclease activity A
MSMYSMSLSERIKIRLEICYENFLDFLGQSAFRKPLLMLVGVGVIMTLKNSRHSIASFKRSYMPSFASKWSSPNQFSPYGSTSAYNSYGSSPSYGSASSYGGTTGAYGNAGIGAKTPLGAQYGGGSMATGSMSAPYGGATSNASPYQQRPQQSYGQTGGAMAQTTSTFGNNLRGTTQISASFSTSRLVDQHGQNVQVAQGGLFQDYGGITSFMGQIDTVSAMESLSSVQQILNSPGKDVKNRTSVLQTYACVKIELMILMNLFLFTGNGKVLVVDGGGSFNGAVLDELTATAGQRNGWKGVIINGVVRNADELKKIQFGVKAIGAHLSVGQQSNSQRGSPLSFGGVNFTPGSWIYADQASFDKNVTICCACK